MSKTYNVECYSVTGHKVTFKMHNAGPDTLDKETIAKAAESRLRAMGVPESLATVYQVR